MDRIILHCDLNNFFASVECVDHPELKNVPMAVCGNQDDRHGIVLAKNEIAKKFGVKTAEVIWMAKNKCPDLVIMKPRMEKYIEASKKARQVYANYTDLIEPFGIDECWLDVTGSTLLFGSGYDIAYKIKEQIKKELSLTISVGVSFNKIFAKLGSDMKKPDAITCITLDNFKDKVWPLDASELLGVGKATSKNLIKYGIITIGDIANADKKFLISVLGKNGEALWSFANGMDNDSVAHQSELTIPKSIGNSITCSADLVNEDEVWTVMYKLCESVASRLRQDKLLAGGVQVTVKDNTLSVKEFQSSLDFKTRYPKDLCDTGISLFKKHYDWKKNVRLIGIRAINLIPEDDEIQCSILYDQHKIIEHDNLEEKVFSIRERFGNAAVTRGSLLNGIKAKEQTRDYTSLPNAVFKKK